MQQYCRKLIRERMWTNAQCCASKRQYAALTDPVSWKHCEYVANANKEDMGCDVPCMRTRWGQSWEGGLPACNNASAVQPSSHIGKECSQYTKRLSEHNPRALLTAVAASLARYLLSIYFGPQASPAAMLDQRLVAGPSSRAVSGPLHSISPVRSRLVLIPHHGALPGPRW